MLKFSALIKYLPLLNFVYLIRKNKFLRNILQQTYKTAGVDINAGDETVKRIKKFARSTFSKNVLSDIGLFGGFFELDFTKYENPVLVSSVDGVGTKLKIAIASNIHNTVGQDLVNHCVNDIAVCGAEPLFFLDYLAFGKLNPDTAEKIVEGFSIACKENSCSLIGGETAEMPGLYSENDYDISGTIVGIVEKKNIINGKTIMKDDLLIGFKSNGLHTNGYSLARKVLHQNLTSFIDELDNTLENEFLKIHKSYLKLINHLKNNIEIKGFSHITGGGIVSNTMRIIPDNLEINIDWKSWEIPVIFKLIKNWGNISDEEMRKVFNLGIGLIAIISPSEIDRLKKLAQEINEEPVLIGGVF